MKIVLFLAALVAIPATAQTPGLQFKLACDKSNIVVLIKANAVGLYRMDIPADVCGKFI